MEKLKRLITKTPRNLLALFIPPVPGIIIFVIASELLPKEPDYYKIISLSLSIAALVLLFPWTYEIAERIRKGDLK